MAEDIKKQLIDVEGLGYFLANTDKRYAKIGEGGGGVAPDMSNYYTKNDIDLMFSGFDVIEASENDVKEVLG